MGIPHWDLGNSTDTRWNTPLTQKLLGNPWMQVVVGIPGQSDSIRQQLTPAGQALLNPGGIALTAAAQNLILPVNRYLLPGVCRVEEVEQKISVQNNKRSGGDGGRPTIRGRDNPDFIVHMQLVAPSHFVTWQQMEPMFRVTEHPTERNEFYVDHPLVALAGITWCILLKVKHRMPNPTEGMRVELLFLGCSERPSATKVPQRGSLQPGLQNPATETPTVDIPDTPDPGADFTGNG